MVFKDDELDFCDEMDFRYQTMRFLSSHTNKLFSGDEEDETQNDLGSGSMESRRQIMRKVFLKKYGKDLSRSGRLGKAGKRISANDRRRVGKDEFWKKEEGYYEQRGRKQSEELSKNRSWEKAGTYERSQRRGIQKEGQRRAEEENRKRTEGAEKGITEADRRPDTGNDAAGKPGDNPNVRKAAQKTQVANLIKQGKLKPEGKNDAGFWSGAGDPYAGQKIPPKEKGLLATTVGVFGSNVMIAIILMIASMALLPVTLGMFVSIHMVSESVESMLSGFPGRGQILARGSLSEEEIDAIVAECGASGSQEQVIRFALTKVGLPYSQALRTSGSAYDCSSLAFYAWQAAGVDLSFGTGYPPTAAAMASMLYSNGTVVSSTTASSESLQPGDLIFYGGHNNGRYLGIYHVAVYLGNGKVVEAMNEQYGVVYGTIRTKNVILVLRP